MRNYTALFCGLIIALFSYSDVAAQNAVTPGTIRTDATFENISINYAIAGDVNRNSSLTLRYRAVGALNFEDGAITMRAFPGMIIDGSSTSRNFHAGSCMYLNPATTYEVELTLSDPNGGGTVTSEFVTTKSIPQPASSANIRYVSPGNGGGNGTINSPYLGLQAAANNAQAGDHFIVSAGNYDAYDLQTSGTASNPISFISEPQHGAVINGAGTDTGVITLGTFNTGVSHIIIDGFTIENGVAGIDAQNTQFITVRNNILQNVDYGYVNRRENGLESDQYITNNLFVGTTGWPQSFIPNERGVDIRGNNNVVSYNTIRNFGDGVSTDGPAYETSYSLDIHNNDIQNIVDDHIEVDGIVSNARIYANRCFNGRAGVSVAPIYGGPAYIVRNLLFNNEISALKMNRGPSGIVIAHNTAASYENVVESPDGWQNTYARNNVFLASRYCFEFFGLVPGSQDDWDYGAYYSTRGGQALTEWFKWNNIRYAQVPNLQASGILEGNCVEVAFSDFENAELPESFPIEFQPDERDFSPVSGSPVINTGAALANLNNGFVTDGSPDRGAVEFGADEVQYGIFFEIAPVQDAVTAGAVRLDATFENISVNYAISDDGNRNSDLTLRYREAGSGQYQDGAITMRAFPGMVIDGSTTNRNFHAGSCMFLAPGTTYEIEMTLTDPDGGGTVTTQTVSTKSIPQPSTSANIRYVSPGNGGGNGTQASPFLGLQAAADNAQAGDHFIVAPGNYNGFTLLNSGTSSNPISFISEEQHAAVISGAGAPGGVVVIGDFNTIMTHIILDGFTIENGDYGIDAQNTQHVTVRNNIMQGVGYGYVNRRENGNENDQYITNNLMVGTTAWPQTTIPNERAVDIRGNNNVVSWNTIRYFGDGVSTDGPPYETSYSLDIHNNDIHSVVDDHIEVDGIISNARIYSNRCYNGRAGVSVAPIYGGPAYILRNLLFNLELSGLKMNRGPSGIVAVHNTSVSDQNVVESSNGWQNTYFRNNVFLGSRYCFEFYGLVPGSEDDWDYGAYYSTRGGQALTEWFKWDNIRYAQVPQLQASGILEANCIEVAFNDFVNAELPEAFPVEYSTDQRDFTPVPGSAVIDNGGMVTHLNQAFVSDGQPDRGAIEFGEEAPLYGTQFVIAPIEDFVTAGEVRLDATFENISVNYAISNDGNRNSNLTLRYRQVGAGNYRDGAITMRAFPGMVIDGSSTSRNFHAGSCMFLTPGTAYEIEMTLTDPDGGNTVTTETISTKAIPQPSANANERFVAPGNGGGNGTQASPFLGLQTAANNAQPGDLFLVAGGVYTPFTLLNSGTEADPISFRSLTQHAPIVNGSGTASGIIQLGDFNTIISHVIIDGFTIENGEWGIDAQNTQFVTVRNNIIQNVEYGYVNRRENGNEGDQYITNNLIIGNTAWPQTIIPNERGIDIRGNNNVVSYNTIENFGDGVSTDGPPYQTSYSLDIHNNEILNMVDDHIEIDGIISNARVYANRCFNGRAGVSIAPIYGGPAYVLRNQLFNMDNSAFKLNRGPSGVVVAHNTSVSHLNVFESPDGWQNTYLRNNVFLASRYCFEMFGLVEGSEDDWDYGAYYSTRGGGVGTEWFKWNDIRYAQVPQLQASGLIEANSLEVAFDDFVNADLPDAFPVEYSTNQRNLSPVAGSAVLNNGADLDNLNSAFVSDGAPDRGALEFGEEVPPYGHDFSANACPTDLDGDGSTDINDFIEFNSFFGIECTNCPADFDNSGEVDVNDFLILNSQIGLPCN